MKYYHLVRLISLTTLALGLLLAAALPVWAQSGPKPLPTAPGADRETIGGGTQAAASLPGPGENKSPLEPWLVTWLLPVSGIFAVIVAVSVDKRMRAMPRSIHVRSTPATRV
ncbi:MAG: hypothetical protein NVSMB64_21850 [Candidatus Velthaea sp.]